MAIELSEKQIKDGWQIVKFGEISKNISKRVEPSETDLEVYVGLEHLDPQSLRITRRGVPADVKGQKLRVRPGQIIFGKRRAYQKKVAVADFEGICSAHAMVLEEVVGKIIPGLLPFFMQSDMFMDRAVAISEGSLSPTIKWKTLAIQEFPLPPIERQKEILEVLEKLEECISRTNGSIILCEKLIRTFIFHCKKACRTKYKFTNLGNSEYFKIESGGTPNSGTSDYWNGDINWVTLVDLPQEDIFTELSRTERQISKKGLSKSSAKLLPEGSILVSSRATIGRVAIAKVPTATNQGFKNIVLNNEGYINTFVLMWILGQQKHLDAISAGGTFKEISKREFEKIPIPKIPLDSQKHFANVFENSCNQRNALKEQLQRQKLCKRKFYADILNGGVL